MWLDVIREGPGLRSIPSCFKLQLALNHRPNVLSLARPHRQPSNFCNNVCHTTTSDVTSFRSAGSTPSVVNPKTMSCQDAFCMSRHGSDHRFHLLRRCHSPAVFLFVIPMFDTVVYTISSRFLALGSAPKPSTSIPLCQNLPFLPFSTSPRPSRHRTRRRPPKNAFQRSVHIPVDIPTSCRAAGRDPKPYTALTSSSHPPNVTIS